LSTRIVAISHTWGSGGEHVGRSVAKRLGFRYVDDEVIARAAEKEGIDAELVADAERRKSWLGRLLDDIGRVSLADPGAGALAPDEVAHAQRKDLPGLIVAAIHDLAEQGNVVIVAHAASIPLAGRTDLLRVFVTASVETRVQRLGHAASGDPGQAAKIVKDSDAARADYFRRFYGITQEVPTHYDVVVNTDALSMDEAIAVVLAATRRE
jgi:cytidylate kinase